MFNLATQPFGPTKGEYYTIPPFVQFHFEFDTAPYPDLLCAYSIVEIAQKK